MFFYEKHKGHEYALDTKQHDKESALEDMVFRFTSVTADTLKGLRRLGYLMLYVQPVQEIKSWILLKIK